MESIQSTVGFHGWKCQSYFKYVLGLCPYDNTEMVLAGEDCKLTTHGTYLVKTHSNFPFAMGRVDEHNSLDDARVTKWSDDELKVQFEALKMSREYFESDTHDTRDISDKVNRSSRHDQQFVPEVVLVD